MTTIHLIQPDASTVTLSGDDGKSLMQVATGAGIAGIVGECGGSAMCATCHVYVAEDWLDKLPPPEAPELEMLECTAADRLPNSRLGCQIRLGPALEGLTVRLPQRQQ